jgi:hypothetical protein
MKKIIMFLVASLFPVVAYAQDFPIIVDLPAAVEVRYNVSQINPADNTWTPNGSNVLNFSSAGGGLQFLTGPNIWVGKRYFAIDASPTLVDGTPAPGAYNQITFTYSGQVVPAGQPVNEGLNNRAVMTAVRVNPDETEDVIVAGTVGSGLRTINGAEVNGGFLRVYLGLATGETDINGIPLIAGSVPFTNGDRPGSYNGTVTITATLL